MPSLFGDGIFMSEPPAGRSRLEAYEGCFALCGARLKELFKKSSLRIFKHFRDVVSASRLRLRRCLLWRSLTF